MTSQLTHASGTPRADLLSSLPIIRPAASERAQRLVVDRDPCQGHNQQDRRQRGSEAPVDRLRELIVDQHGEGVFPQAPKQSGGDKEAEAQDKDEQGRSPHPRHAERQEHVQEGARGACSQAFRRLHQPQIDLVIDAIQDQDCGRQQVVRHSDQDAR